MKKSSTTHRFEVDFKTRQKQSKEAKQIAANRATGKVRYLVTDPVTKENLNQLYGIRSGMKYSTALQNYFLSNHSINFLFDELSAISTIQWHTPKQATLLRLQGYTLEEQQISRDL